MGVTYQKNGENRNNRFLLPDFYATMSISGAMHLVSYKRVRK
jgi:hypothetical protein